MSDEMIPHPKWAVSTSPTVGAIAKALAAAQLAMGPAIKDRVGVIPGKDGRQGYQYGYATLAACFEAIQPMHAQGIAVTQIPLDGGQNGVLVATLLIHESGEWIRGEMWVPVTKNDAQGYGSALTYARRYGLSALCGLGTDDDDGEAAAKSKPGPTKAPAQAPQQKAAPVVDLKLFADICDRVDAAETAAQLDAAASEAMKAHRSGAISDAQLAQIKTSGGKRRTLVAPANGGAS